jgi:hypothetical protein
LPAVPIRHQCVVLLEEAVSEPVVGVLALLAM